MAFIPMDFSMPDHIPDTLPVLPLRVGVVLPAGIVPLPIGRPATLRALDEAKDGLVLVARQKDSGIERPGPDDLHPMAVLARVVERKPGRGGGQVAMVQGLCRVRLTSFTAKHPYLRAPVALIPQHWPEGDVKADALERTFRETLAETADVLGAERQLLALIQAIGQMPLLVDAVGALLEAPEEWLTELLLELDPLKRTQQVLQRLTHLKEVLSAQRSIRDKMAEDAQNMSKEQILRRQLKAIKDELGEGGSDEELDRLRERLEEKDLPGKVQEAVARELKRLDRLNSASPERSVALDWLEWVADLPWNDTSAVETDFDAIEEALSSSHYGLEDVKKQVVQHLAVRRLAGSGRADVLLLVGPPGVGKTSIAQAIAEATGRELLRIALGGVRDEAELRGHRRTYIGSRPGRIIEGLRRAGTADPVVVLDEVDKLVQGYHGDPAAALLEILDPEQNHSFTDHYMEVPFDLSRALFVATANDLSPIRGPLKDRMEVINIAGYTREEKVVIARRHLLGKLAQNAGVDPEDVQFGDGVLEAIIAGWTREAGVRQLQRELGKVYRAAAVEKARERLTGPLAVGIGDLKGYLGRPRFQADEREVLDRPGIATGLAWTPDGGDVLYIETSAFPGNGQLVLTGQLGDVMKESARAALTYVLAHHTELGIDPDFLKNNSLHVHVPAGAVPKDGPSAGVTMFTAIASLLSGRPVRRDVAMTGEATLRGRVLPVGGIKSKVLAAHRHGVTRVILPKQNELDVEEVPEEARKEIEFVFVSHMDEVLEQALEPGPTNLDLAENAVTGAWTGVEQAAA